MPINIKKYNQKAETVGEIALDSKIFDQKANEALVHQVAVAQAANERQVLADTKDKSEVRGGGRKPWRQKGTARARAGSSRSPLWRGGGVTFGPLSERNFKKDVNRKMKRGAICSVLSDRLRSEKLFVLDQLVADDYKTKDMEKVVKGFEKLLVRNLGEAVKTVRRSFLIISEAQDEKLKYSTRNLVGVKIINLNNINILDLLKHDNLLLTEKSVELLTKTYAAKAE